MTGLKLFGCEDLQEVRLGLPDCKNIDVAQDRSDLGVCSTAMTDKLAIQPLLQAKYSSKKPHSLDCTLEYCMEAIMI